MPHPDTWLKVLPDGLFCEPGGFHIDPVRPVERAVITHAHADHARPGNRAVLASPETLAIMRTRMGEAAGPGQALARGERITLGEVTVWLQPAGHVLRQRPGGDGVARQPGSGQRRLQAAGGPDLRTVRADPPATSS